MVYIFIMFFFSIMKANSEDTDQTFALNGSVASDFGLQQYMLMVHNQSAPFNSM